MQVWLSHRVLRVSPPWAALSHCVRIPAVPSALGQGALAGYVTLPKLSACQGGAFLRPLGAVLVRAGVEMEDVPAAL